MEQKKIIVKVVYQNQKFKQILTDEVKSFKSLKTFMAEKINKTNNLQDASKVISDNLQCLDNSDYEYDDDEIVSDYVQNNDVIKLVNKQQQQQNSNNNNDDVKNTQQNTNSNLPDNIAAKQQDIIHQQVQQQEEEQQQEQLQQQQKQEDPVEAVVVIYDVSGSMGCRFYGDKDLSRIGATNAFFSAFADKTMAFEFNHLLALYCFDSQIQLKCDFTNNYQQFINMVDSCSPGSATRLYDSVQIAIDKLLTIKKKYPNIILRIIAMSDGEDNQSKSQPLELAQIIVKNKIIMDSFVVSDSCMGLKQITHASGGKCYRPYDLVQGLQLFEIETILSAKSRGIQKTLDQLNNLQVTPEYFENLKQQPFDSEGIQIERPQEMQKAVESAQQIVQKMKKQEQEGKKVMGGASSKRIYKELNDIINNPDSHIKYFPTADDITNWKVLMIGVDGSLYSKGIYLIHVQFPSDYPFKPPRVNFITNILHCNISTQGSLCLDILKDQWSPALTIQKVLLSIQGLLLDPNPNDALNSDISSMMLDRDLKGQYKDRILNHVEKHATPGLDDIMDSIMGNNADKNSVPYMEKKKEIEVWLNKTLAINAQKEFVASKNSQEQMVQEKGKSKKK